MRRQAASSCPLVITVITSVFQTDRSRNGQNSLHPSRRRPWRTLHLDQDVPLSHTAAGESGHESGGAAAPEQVNGFYLIGSAVDGGVFGAGLAQR